MENNIPVPVRDYNQEIELANLKLQEITNLKDQLETENFNALWQDETPSDWVKYLPIAVLILQAITMILIFVKK